MRILYHILYPNGLGDDTFTYKGYRHAFEDMGHEVFELIERDDLRDAIERVRPDMFISEGNFAMADLERNAELFKKFRQQGGKVVMRGAMTQQLVKKIKEESIIDKYFSEIDPTEEFPDFPPDLYVRMHWLAASKKYHFPSTPSPKYACDIMYLGVNLPKKRDAFKRLLLPLKKKYKVNIYGGDWHWFDRFVLHPLARIERVAIGSSLFSRLRFLTMVPLDEERAAYASAKICINIHESHENTDLKTINARTFKIPASGGFELVDHVPQIREFFSDDEVVMPKNDAEWFPAIDYYMAHDGERKRIQEKATAKACREHTFHNRVETILRFVDKR